MALTLNREELGAGHLVIHVEPQVLAEHCQVDGIVILGRHQVVVHVGADVRHLVQERQVILVKVVLLEELVEFVRIGVGIKRLVHIREDRGTQLVLATR